MTPLRAEFEQAYAPFEAQLDRKPRKSRSKDGGFVMTETEYREKRIAYQAAMFGARWALAMAASRCGNYAADNKAVMDTLPIESTCGRSAFAGASVILNGFVDRLKDMAAALTPQPAEGGGT
jgi:hypothetical protein